MGQAPVQRVGSRTVGVFVQLSWAEASLAGNALQNFPKSKEVLKGIPKGTLFHEVAGGGGGYGDPLKRPLERVLKDVRNGFVSIEKAKEDYGVVIDPVTHKVNEEETNKRRHLK